MQDQNRPFKPAPPRPRPAGYHPVDRAKLRAQQAAMQPATPTRTQPVRVAPQPTQPPRPQAPTKKAKVKKPRAQRNTLTILLVVMLVVFASALVGLGIYFFVSTRNQQAKTPASTAADQATAIVDKLQATVELPSDEKPTVVEVKDVSKLAGQAFFAKAQNGDQVLVYQKNGVAILFRPSSGKLVNFANYNPNTSASPSSTQ